MDRRTFKARAVAAARRANPDAADLTIAWTREPVTVTWADGSDGWSGTVALTATGFRARRMTASWSPTIGLMVR